MYLVTEGKNVNFNLASGLRHRILFIFVIKMRNYKKCKINNTKKKNKKQFIPLDLSS